MARIRSVHPGLYTDEAFMTLSMAARVLIVGLWLMQMMAAALNGNLLF